MASAVALTCSGNALASECVFCLESGQRAEQVKVQQKQDYLEAPYLTIHLRAGVDNRIDRVRVRTVLASHNGRTNHPHIRMRLEILLAQLHEIIVEIQVHLLLVPSPKQRRISIEMVLMHEPGTLVNGRMV